MGKFIENCIELTILYEILVGLTATNALSEQFEITSYRDGKMRLLQFVEGKKSADRIASQRKGTDKHGLIVGFKPSTIYLGADCTLPENELDDWLTKLSFMMNPGIKIKYIRTGEDEETPITKTYKNTKGIGGFLENFQPSANLLKNPIVLSSNTTILEENIPTHDENGQIVLINKTRSIDLEVAINYNQSGDEMERYSFVNNIETIEHGEHVNAVINAFITFMRKKVKDASKKSDFEVTNADILAGAAIVLYMNTDYSTGLFTGQTKHKMDNKIFYDPIRKMVNSTLTEYFDEPENKKVLTKVTGFIIENVKARLAATKARTKVKRNHMSFTDTTLIVGYTAPNNIDVPDAYRELYIVEGNSAGGSARAGRYDPDIQGTLGLTGKPSNAYGETYQAMEKSASLAPDVKELFDNILGCGYGDHFSMDGLRYSKIILMPDADVDGDHIAGLLGSNIYKHARPLIEKGKVFRVLTPLYRLRGGTKKNGVDTDTYLFSKDEYYDVYEKRASENIRLKFELDDKDFISKSNMKRFLETNREYFKWLDTMAGQYTLHRDIIEYIASHPDFKETISEFSNELKYDKKNDSIFGIYDGNFYNIILDKIFLENVKVLTDAINIGNNGIYKYHVFKKYKSKSEPEYLGYMTIGQVMAICQEYEVPIESRYKGLGELNKDEMHALAMNPNNRVLVKLTIADVETTTDIMDSLFLKERRGDRKQMLIDMDVSVDDIDS